MALPKGFDAAQHERDLEDAARKSRQAARRARLGKDQADKVHTKTSPGSKGYRRRLTAQGQQKERGVALPEGFNAAQHERDLEAGEDLLGPPAEKQLEPAVVLHLAASIAAERLQRHTLCGTSAPAEN